MGKPQAIAVLAGLLVVGAGVASSAGTPGASGGEAALESAREAIWRAPAKAGGYEALARAQLAAGQRRQAMETLTVGVQAAPSEAGPYLALAELVLAVGDHQLAWDLLRSARAADPSDDRIDEVRERLGRPPSAPRPEPLPPPRGELRQVAWELSESALYHLAGIERAALAFVLAHQDRVSELDVGIRAGATKAKTELAELDRLRGSLREAISGYASVQLDGLADAMSGAPDEARAAPLRAEAFDWEQVVTEIGEVRSAAGGDERLLGRLASLPVRARGDPEALASAGQAVLHAASDADPAFAKRAEAAQRAPLPLPRYHRLVLDGALAGMRAIAAQREKLVRVGGVLDRAARCFEAADTDLEALRSWTDALAKQDGVPAGIGTPLAVPVLPDSSDAPGAAWRIGRRSVSLLGLLYELPRGEGWLNHIAENRLAALLEDAELTFAGTDLPKPPAGALPSSGPPARVLAASYEKIRRLAAFAIDAALSSPRGPDRGGEAELAAEVGAVHRDLVALGVRRPAFPVETRDVRAALYQHDHALLPTLLGCWDEQAIDAGRERYLALAAEGDAGAARDLASHLLESDDPALAEHAERLAADERLVRLERAIAGLPIAIAGEPIDPDDPALRPLLRALRGGLSALVPPLQARLSTYLRQRKQELITVPPTNLRPQTDAALVQAELMRMPGSFGPPPPPAEAGPNDPKLGGWPGNDGNPAWAATFDQATLAALKAELPPDSALKADAERIIALREAADAESAENRKNHVQALRAAFGPAPSSCPAGTVLCRCPEQHRYRWCHPAPEPACAAGGGRHGFE